MPYTVYDFVDSQDRNLIKNWASGLQKSDRAKLNVKLDMLKQTGPDLSPKLLSHTGSAHIRKLRIFGQGKVQLRPMLCEGPINNQTEFTLLCGAVEKGSKLIPANADDDAESYRQEVIADQVNRRRQHERVS